MRITPVTFSPPAAPPSYSWEATDDEVSARYGVPIERIVRFDLNTSPTPPELVAPLLAAGRFETRLSEYPPSDYRRLIEAAAERYDAEPGELLVGAGADEVLDIITKAFLPSDGAAVLPTPTYALYGVLSGQRGARIKMVPRRPAVEGWALDADAVADSARGSSLVWLCSPNNPTGRPEPDGAIEALLDRLRDDAADSGRPGPIVVLDEAYAEFVGTSLAGLRHAHPELIVVRTASKAYALAGLRVGFAVARPELITRMNPYRPPGSVSTVSVSVVTAALRDPTVLDRNLRRVEAERARLAEGLAAAGWSAGPSVTNFLLVDFGDPRRTAVAAEGLLRRGLVPRTFPAGHPVASCLRLTVRDPEENDRLIAAAGEIDLADEARS